MTGTRNPSRKYFKRNQPYFYKSADNWEEWDTDESYDRTFFIGIDDSNPADIDVALYMIWGGKAVAVVGSKVLDTVSGVVDTARQLETEIQSILKEVQELSAKVAQSAIDIEQAITEMNALVDRCEGILDGAEAARDLAKDWANKMNGTVDGTEYSAKYYANEAKNSETAAAGSATNASASATTATEQAAAASTSANQSATSASTAASYASSAHIDASGAANSAQAAQDSATSAANSATNAANSETNSANSATSASASAQAAQEALNDVHGLIATPIGTIFQSIYVDESLDIARQLNGQLISSTKFTGFRSWLNTVQTAAPNLFTTETNWQAEKTNSKLGQCGKFVIDDTAGTIRLPCVVNAQGLADLALIGVLKSESLPNITGSFIVTNMRGNLDPKGCFSSENVNNVAGTDGAATTRPAKINLDSSRSSSTYKDNAPVQQEAIQYPYYIQVATGVEETLPAIREYEINTPFFFGQSMYSDVAPDNASWLVSNGQYNAKTVYPDYYNWILENVNKGTENFKLSAGNTIYQFKGNTTETEAYTPSFTIRNPIVGSVCYGGSPLVPIGEVVGINPDGSLHCYGRDLKDYVDLVFKQELLAGDWFITDYDWVVNTADETFRLPLLDGSEDLQGSTGETISVGNYTLPKNGSVKISAESSTSGRAYVWVRSNSEFNADHAYSAGTLIQASIAAKKGTSINIAYENCTNAVATFTPAVGNGSLYYYVGDTVQDASLINAGAVLGQLSNKADIDASNFNASGKSLLSGLGMPSSRYIDLTLGASGSTYTAPANGWFVLLTNGLTYLDTYRANDVFGSISHPNNVYAREFVPMQKGQSLEVYYTGTPTDTDFRFYYAEGEE